jgi:broad specificity phosphatase PhoE
MQILFVRHGESLGNVEGRMQGRRDYDLSERGRAQAAGLAEWFSARGLDWAVAYSSPQLRARATAERLNAGRASELVLDDHLCEVAAGRLEGLDREEIAAQFPDFMQRGITGLGDFAEYGGESYEQVQARVARFRERLFCRHRAAEDRVLVVAHGGIGFQLLKSLICEPVPRVCILRIGNCSATLIRMRERRGLYMGELTFHVPLSMVSDAGERDGDRIFR